MSGIYVGNALLKNPMVSDQKKTLKHFNPRGGSDMEVSMGLPTARWMVYYPVVDVYITMENHNF